MLLGKGISCGTESCVCLWQAQGQVARARLGAGKGEDETRAMIMSTSTSWFIVAVLDLTPLCLTPLRG